MAQATAVTTCGHCGGDAGRLNENGVHSLCAARARRGLPTPSLGTTCERCSGTTFEPIYSYNSCARCGGNGVEPGSAVS